MEAEKPAISVIVPVYNSEAYLRRTLDRILGQSFHGFELLLVDDGSTDRSGSVCDEYAKRDGRIRVIHRQNGGLSAARNTGTEAAWGEYLTYIDSDDLIEPCFLEKLYGLITRYQADTAVCGMAILGEKEAEAPIPQDEVRETCMTGREMLEQMLLGKIHGSSACGILLRTETGRKYPFPPGKTHEDDFTSYQYYLSSERAAATTEKLYRYIQREGSITHSAYGQADRDMLDSGDAIVSGCRNENKAIMQAAEYKRFTNYCQVLFENEHLKTTDPAVWKRIRKGLKETRKSVALNAKCEKSYRNYARFMMACGAGLFMRLFEGKIPRNQRNHMD